jgi:hypothetical protein
MWRELSTTPQQTERPDGDTVTIICGSNLQITDFLRQQQQMQNCSVL